MYDVKEINDEMRTKLLEVYVLMQHMRDNNMPESDLNEIESRIFDVLVCTSKLNR